DRRAEDPCLGERRVEAAIRPEPVAQSCRCAKHTARATDVLADDEHGRIALELDVERVVDRFDNREISHRGSSGARPDQMQMTRADRHTHARTEAPDQPAALPRPPRSLRASTP